MKTIKSACGAVVAAGLIIPSVSQAGVTFTIGNPGAQASTVAGVVTENFDSQPLGAFSGNWMDGANLIGTFSPGGSINAPDAFGCAGASDYYAIGAQSGSLAASLSFANAEDYFGMWWPAGDAGNQLVIKNGSTVLGDYRVSDLLGSLNPSYFGNPNNGQDGGEPFVYLNFTATGVDQITSVEFLNDSTGTGFEMDNISVIDQVIIPPGNPVPDAGSSMVLIGLGASSLMILRRKLVR